MPRKRKPAPAAAAASPATPTPSRPLLRGLGIFGWDDLEPLVVAALATEAPILLVGAHGTAKSLLLERLAEALQLRFRHYNASILNFDDLVGFPVPDGDRVRYLRTPLDAWDAEALFVDEISRCRPDLQNRLFPLIHERRLQGERLQHLRFRWAAMNPPPAPDEDLQEAAYAGSEPLDTALADRFPWVIQVPERLGERDRLAVICGDGERALEPEPLRQAVTATRQALLRAEAAHGKEVAAYVSAAGHALGRADIQLSSRRLRMLHQGIVALIASGCYAQHEHAALAGLTWGLPQRARGHVPGDSILAAHAAAAPLLAAHADGERTIRMRLLAEHDPVERVVLALAHGDADITTSTVLDAHAALRPAERLAFARWLFPALAEVSPPLHGILFETLGADAGKVLAVHEEVELVRSNSLAIGRADEVSKIASSLRPGEGWIEDVLWIALKEEAAGGPHDVVAFARRLVERLPRRAESAEGAAA